MKTEFYSSLAKMSKFLFYISFWHCFSLKKRFDFFPNLNSKHFFVGGVRFSFLLEPSIEDEPKIISHPI